MSETNALRDDRAGLTEEAAKAYEEALIGAPTIEDLLNLAVLYWQATDPGMASGGKLSPGFFELAAQRFPELLAVASSRYPTSTEVRFWSQYIAWADYGEALDIEACRRLLREDPKVLVPAMHIFALSQGREGRPEAEELLRQCREAGTSRARYVASVIEGVMKRVEFQSRQDPDRE